MPTRPRHEQEVLVGLLDEIDQLDQLEECQSPYACLSGQGAGLGVWSVHDITDPAVIPELLDVFRLLPEEHVQISVFVPCARQGRDHDVDLASALERLGCSWLIDFASCSVTIGLSSIPRACRARS